MDFSLSEEQQLLSDSATKYVADHCDVERHRRLSKTELGFDEQCWKDIAELGWLYLPFTEEQGGIGGNAVDLMVLAEALGRGLVREPWLHTAVICGSLLRFSASPEQQEQYLPALMAGDSQWAFAFAEDGAGYSLTPKSVQAEPAEAGWSITGTKTAVLNGHCADHLVVSACTDTGEAALFVVDGDSQGVRHEPFTAVDGSRGAVVHLEGVKVSADNVLAVSDAVALIELAVDRAIVAMGGEALGAMQSLLEATVEYTKTRKQFGQAIGKFQALQHRMADMYLKVEEVRALLYNAAIQLDEAGDSAAACAGLKVKIGEASRFVSQQAVQLHGGIGMTDELIVGHHYKRLLLLSKLFGDEDYYLQRYMNLAA